MLVYANTLWLASECGFDAPVEIAARWLSRKTKRSFSADTLKENEFHNIRGDQHVQSWVADGEFPIMLAFRYSHPDSDVRGRTWTTEFGVQRDGPNEEIRCTILLEITDISARVDAPVSTSQPGLVAEIGRQCSFSDRMPRAVPAILNEKGVDTFLATVHRADRRYPIVLVSPTSDGEYLIAPEVLASSLVGLAQTLKIPLGTDTFSMADVVGRDYMAWRGALNIIWAPRMIRGERVVRHRRIMIDELQELDLIGRKSHILTHIVHESNLVNSRLHVAPATVRKVAENRERKRDLERRRRDVESSGEQKELLEFLQEAFNEQEATIASLSERNDTLESQAGELDDQIRSLRYENETLIASFAAFSTKNSGGETLTETDREALRALAAENPILEQSLRVMEIAFPERVIILDSAWKSARDSAAFQSRLEAFSLVFKLLGPYWEALVHGYGDAQARAIFGSAFAATESETVRNNKRAKQLRTFIYDGAEIEMMAHLKIGIKDSVAETLRIHFLWDAKKKKIVIGHCGRHLDFN